MEVLEDLEAATLIPRYSPSNETLAAVCSDSVVTPACLRTLYGTIDYTAKAPGKNQIGLTNYQGNSNNRSDIEQFLKRFRPDAAGAAYKFLEISIAGGSVSQAPDNGTGAQDLGHIEGDLDAEWVIGMSYPTPLTAYSTGGVSPFKPDGTEPVDTNEPFLAWVQYTLAQPSIPQVISQSYSATEQTFPKAYATTVCRLFAQLATHGVTMLFSSGDFGVGQSGACFANDGTHARAFLPPSPAAVPTLLLLAQLWDSIPKSSHWIRYSDLRYQVSRLPQEVASATTLPVQSTKTSTCPNTSPPSRANSMVSTTSLAVGIRTYLRRASGMLSSGMDYYFPASGARVRQLPPLRESCRLSTTR